MESEEKKELTKREKDVIKSYDNNKCVKMLAKDLGIAEKTFYTHQQNILKKTGLASMTHVVARYKKDWTI